MCGIVGILGTHEVAPILLDGLKRLEYRGYDSAGIATVNDGHLDRRRATGKLINLSDLLVNDPLRGKAGIGHTRWATHGAPNTMNAHPHKSGPVAVVHNGIIENFKPLRQELEEAGYAFETDTDTETIAVLIRSLLDAGRDARSAAAEAIGRLEGAFALLLLFEGEDDLMIAARKGSPLAIGHGDGEMYVGSDALALAPMTSRVTYLEEGDRAVITRAGAEIFDTAGRRANRDMEVIQLDLAASEKGQYRHFMAKEIHEQPTVVGNAISHYLTPDCDDTRLPDGGLDFASADRVILVACGTAHYACLVAKYWFEQLAGLPVDMDIASEFRYREPPVSDRSIAIFVSQSGETADTLAAMRYVRGKAARIVSVVNVPTSSIARESDLALPILAGTEIGVASTKAFTCQLAVLAALAIEAGRQRGALDAGRVAALCQSLRRVPGLMNIALACESEIKSIAARISEAQDVLFLGRGAMFPLALEGALKLKEISYIHAEGYASGELKHGPIALIDKKVPVVVMTPHDALFEKTVSNMQEVMARKGRVLLITDATGAAEAGEGIWRSIIMPEIDPIFAPILYAIPAQLLAYHAAVTKGTDVDQPRNLAKSVTVE
ncbi:glutamine--fructose-6-phosphate transaminase (isomerizing) [Maritimibacter sp. 55A14]|uniref:glutamine--fructose-6-phosphate transaminase (isomerizing) n=1 Tax=Maritimibacter sp. 55A14 TaxID=2174844 RepID=UPI000D60CB4C|nr:glutamine--fructose-6-phosphate transaminase (isomerizing) [Maritimibacter sp. 55A14]PWE33959.1 glutamine--fructose-6-phosphate transaminase (isomerizing) [Maritimibacter sp. 55A14]